MHLIHSELFAEAAAAGYRVGPGDLGENLTTVGVALLELPVGTRLHLGACVVRLTGLRNPCRQINDFQPGLLKVVVARADGVASTSQPTLGPTGGVLLLDDGPIVRKAGVMGVVDRGGDVAPGRSIEIELPTGPHHRLEPV